MNQVEILLKQTKGAYDWTNKLLNSIPQDTWDTTPAIIESNVSWQVGHLIVSFYYHSIMVIAGHQMDILGKVPLKEYDMLFTAGEPQKVVGKINPKVLQDQLNLMELKSLEIIQSLSENDLEDKLVPTPISHPIAKNKFEALDWNIKHTMWHCGQLGLLKRIIHERYDFGLKMVK
jgi:hypothetical protein